MCGIIGVVGRPNVHVNQLIYDALLLLQHRGQDSTGIATAEPSGVFHITKARGQVREAFRTRDMRSLLGTIGLGAPPPPCPPTAVPPPPCPPAGSPREPSTSPTSCAPSSSGRNR